MARRKKHTHKKHHSRRRSRMSGISSGIGSAAMVAGGAILASVLIQKVISPATSSQSATVRNVVNGVAPIALGLLTPKFIKGATGANLGAGMIAVGGLNLVKTTGLISGIGDMNYYGNKPVKNIAGYQANEGSYIAGIKNAAMMEHC